MRNTYLINTIWIKQCARESVNFFLELFGGVVYDEAYQNDARQSFNAAKRIFNNCVSKYKDPTELEEVLKLYGLTGIHVIKTKQLKNGLDIYEGFIGGACTNVELDGRCIVAENPECMCELCRIGMIFGSEPCINLQEDIAPHQYVIDEHLNQPRE